jgi:uncharacterized protein YaaQ
MEKLETAVLGALKKAGKPMKAGEVALAIGAEAKEIAKVIGALKKQGQVVSPKNCYYEPAK